MRRQLLPALRMVLVLTALTGLLYPLAMTGVAQALFRAKADGSIVKDGTGREVGSRLLGQDFSGAAYLHPRPSAAGANGYDAAASSASNLGPTNKAFLAVVRQRIAAYRRENDLGAGEAVPVDAVTASGSGLDPHISVANARLQAPRVARARHLPVATVRRVVDQHTVGRSLGFLGEPGVNVLEVDLGLDQQH